MKALSIFTFLCCIFCGYTMAQTKDTTSPYKIVFSKYNVISDYMDGSDVYLFDSRDSISCLSGFSKKARSPKLSPDGLTAVYNFDGKSLIKVNIESAASEQLLPNVYTYFWHPDGKQIIYQDDAGIHSMDIHAKTSKLLYDDVTMQPFGLSPDGNTVICQKLVQTGGKFPLHMYLLSVKDSVLKLLDGPGEEKRFGSFSNDGKYLIYSGGNYALDDKLYSYDILNKSYKQLTEGTGQDLESVYSPNGDYVCFVSTRLPDERGNYKLYIMNSDGSNQKMIYDKFAAGIRWPINSEYIYFSDAHGIYRIKPDGSDLVKIVDANTDFISDFDIVYPGQLNILGKPADKLQDFHLFQNYPNPFNPSTTISYSIPESRSIKLSLYDLLGNKVSTLVDKLQSSGSHTVQFNAGSLPSGIYIYRIEAGEYRDSRKLMILK